MKKLLKIGNVGLLVIGLSLMTYFVMAGSYVDENGFLIEEFWAWGLGILLVIVSLAGFLIWGIAGLIRRSRS